VIIPNPVSELLRAVTWRFRVAPNREAEAVRSIVGNLATTHVDPIITDLNPRRREFSDCFRKSRIVVIKEIGRSMCLFGVIPALFASELPEVGRDSRSIEAMSEPSLLQRDRNAVLNSEIRKDN
jgi:hypothetical protein